MNLVMPLQGLKFFCQNDCDQHIDGTDFSLLLQVRKYICHFCWNGGLLYIYLLNLKAKFSWCVELMLSPTWCN